MFHLFPYIHKLTLEKNYHNRRLQIVQFYLKGNRLRARRHRLSQIKSDGLILCCYELKFDTQIAKVVGVVKNKRKTKSNWIFQEDFYHQKGKIIWKTTRLNFSVLTFKAKSRYFKYFMDKSHLMKWNFTLFCSFYPMK